MLMILCILDIQLLWNIELKDIDFQQFCFGPILTFYKI